MKGEFLLSGSIIYIFHSTPVAILIKYRYKKRDKQTGTWQSRLPKAKRLKAR